MKDPDQREEMLFQQCLELPPGERSRFLDAACSGNATLRERVLRLVHLHETSGEFMESLPEADVAPLSDYLKNAAKLLEDSPQHLGRYRLIEPIGEGSWSTVWLAEQTEDIRRKVALKILKKGIDAEDVLKRFEAERQTLAMMDHPNIAHVLDAGATPRGRPYFVMELVRGIPLLEYADSHRLSLDARLALFIPICQAVQHAHKRGIIHRDLKPSNILVVLTDDEPVPKIIDFGIAKTTQLHLVDRPLDTTCQSFLGTPVYSSPEQWESGSVEIDYRSDIYSLGVLLYELLCGRTPFEPERPTTQGLESLRMLIEDEDPPWPSQRLSRLSRQEQIAIAHRRASTPKKVEARLKGELDWIVMQCLKKDRSRRYDSGRALARDLDAFLGQRPVSAAAPSALYLTRKFVQREQLSKLLWGALPVLLLGTLVLVLYSETGYKTEGSKRETPLVWVNRSYHPDKSIAVLPFENLGGKEGDVSFSDDIHYELLTQISRIEGLKSIAREATLKYRGSTKNLASIARELEVKTILLGGIRRSGDQVRVHAQLVDTSSGTNLWSGAFTRELTTDKVFEIQSEIARAIAEPLAAMFTPEERERRETPPTQSLAALEASFMEIVKQTPGAPADLAKAGAHFETAIQSDPALAGVYTLLANSCLNAIYHGGSPVPANTAGAGPLPGRAVRLDDRSIESYQILGCLERNRRKIKAAEAAFERAIELIPKQAQGYLNFGRLRYCFDASPDRAIALFRKAIELDPQSVENRVWLARALGRNFQWLEATTLLEALIKEAPEHADAYDALGDQWCHYPPQFDRAIQCYRQAYALDPQHPEIMLKIARAHLQLGAFKTAVFWLERFLSGNPNHPQAPYYRALKLDLQGQPRAALESYATVPESHTHVYLECLYRTTQLAEGSEQALKAIRRWETSLPPLAEREPSYASGALLRQSVRYADALMASGEGEKSHSILDKILRSLPAEPAQRWQIIPIVVLADALSGDLDQALSELRAYVEQGGALRFADEPTCHMTQRAIFNRLKGEAGFIELVAVMQERLAAQRANLIRWEAEGTLAPIPEPAGV